MKKKLLLFGKDKSLVDEFFEYENDNYHMLTTSHRAGDIQNHVDIFSPDAIIFCMMDEHEDTINSIFMAKNIFKKKNIPLILVGNWRECEKFQLNTGRMADLVLKKPITSREIAAELLEYLKGIEQVKKAKAEPFELVEVEDELPVEMLLAQSGKKEAVAEKLTVTSNVVVKKNPKKILVVDDNPTTLRVIRNQLMSEYAVACASSGQLALKYLEGVRPDLVLLDYEMPGQDGAQVLAQIRLDSKTANIPVVFLTGINDVNKIKKVIELKPQAYLLKPIEKTELLQCIAKIIDNK